MAFSSYNQSWWFFWLFMKKPFSWEFFYIKLNTRSFLIFIFLFSSFLKKEITPVITTPPPAQAEVKFVLKVEVSAGGKVDISKGTYVKGTEVTIRATPNNFLNFSGWSNGKRDNPLKVIKDKDL